MIGKILGNRYEIVEKIGGGGMALVYKAKCHLLNRYVAVKVLRPDFTSDEEFIKRFKRESQAAASLSHPNIVNIYDVGTDGETYYIVMEYVKGKTLKQYIREKGRLDADTTIDIAKQICLGLEHAHKNHIVHRDIKPHNILLTEDGIAKVTDFGIARAATSSTVTNVGNVIGSVHYFSPEQARGGYTDEKSDLYSLGIVMYEMITGRVPFEGESPISVALKHIQEDMTPPSELGIDVPMFLEKIIDKSVKKDQSLRYNSASELLLDLNQGPIRDIGEIGVYQEDFNDSPTRKIQKIYLDNLEYEKSINKDDEMKVTMKEKDKKPKKTNKLVVAAAIISALLLSLLAVGGYFVWTYASDYFNVKETEVPQLVGHTRDEAINMLRDSNLQYEIIEEHRADIERGIVFYQDIESGIMVKEKSTIRVRVSKGGETLEMPDLNIFALKGLDIGIELEKLGLIEGDVSAINSDEPVNTIIEQNPREGLVVEKGTIVNYVKSLGPEISLKILPNFVGTQISEAEKDLELLELTRGEIKYVRNPQLPDGEIVSQSIKEFTLVPVGTIISFEVNIREAGSNNSSNNVTQPVAGQNPEESTSPVNVTNPNQGVVSRTEVLQISFEDISKPKFLVTIVKSVLGEGESTIHQQQYEKTDKGFSITVTITKPTKYLLYIDGKLVEEYPFN